MNINLDSLLLSIHKSIYFINRYENELTDIVIDTGIIARVIRDIVLVNSFGTELSIDDLYNLLGIENIFNRQINYDNIFNNYNVSVLNNKISISNKINKQL